MTFLGYLKHTAGEILLVIVSVWAVAVVCLNGFFLDSLLESIGWWGRAAISLCMAAPLVLILYAAAYRSDWMIIGAVLFLASVVLLVLGAMMLSVGESVYEDTEGNYLYFVFVQVVCVTACFLLTRTLIGSVVWFVCAAFACSVVQAFYQSEELFLSVIAALASLALIVYKNFKLGLDQAYIASRPSYAAVFASSVVPVAGVGAVALAVWFFIIAPLNPGVQDIKLVTDYRSFPIEQLKGSADERPILNYELTTQNLVEGFYYTTDDLLEDPLSSTTIDAASLLEQQLQQQLSAESDSLESSGSSTRDSFSEEAADAGYDPQSYTYTFPFIVTILIGILLFILIVAAYFLGRRFWRMHRLRRMLCLSPSDQVVLFYRFIVERLCRLGFLIPDGMTLSEWAQSNRRSMDAIAFETRVPLDILTKTYTSCVYGRHVPTEDEIVPFVAYYLNFWKAARAYLGNLKYFFVSFRL